MKDLLIYWRENKLIDAIDWRNEDYQSIYSNKIAKLQEAIKETDLQRQTQLVIQAMSGNYQRKFGAMAGMLFLASLHLDSGKDALVEAYRQGYRGFVQKLLS